MTRFLSAFLMSTFLLWGATSQATAGEPTNWGLGLQDAASSSAAHLHDFHTLLLYIISGIVAFVFVLLIYVVLRFNKRANPEPKQFSHNVTIEVLWTLVPVLILIVIAVPSFRLLYFLDRTTEPEMTLKVTGYQWYWGYEYPDQGGFSFQSYMVPDEEIKPDQRRLLSTDNVVVLPIDTDIQILVSAADVIHSWAVPALGVKIDAVPGRWNETWVNISKPGVYYGQCSELCGIRHAFMPIEIHVVPQDVFDAWVVASNEDPYEAPQVLYAHYDSLRGETRVAAAR